jgi:hypothetical protein
MKNWERNIYFQEKKTFFLGGVAQWTSNPPQEEKTRVRISPGYNVFRETIANAVVNR